MKITREQYEANIRKAKAEALREAVNTLDAMGKKHASAVRQAAFGAAKTELRRRADEYDQKITDPTEDA